jgi:hypothetical protein
MKPGAMTMVLALVASRAVAEGPAAETGKLFTSPAATLYYEVRGAGSATPLVVINGGPGFDHAYLHVSSAWDALARSRPVLPPSSPASPAPWPTRSPTSTRCSITWATRASTCSGTPGGATWPWPTRRAIPAASPAW